MCKLLQWGGLGAYEAGLGVPLSPPSPPPPPPPPPIPPLRLLFQFPTLAEV